MHRRDFFKYGVAIGAALARRGTHASGELTQVTTSGTQTNNSRGDLALVNGRIVTLDAHRSEAAAALVRNGRIVAIGSTREVKAQASGARVYDAGGRTVVPGFIDAHTHFEMACNAKAYQLSVHTPPYKSLREIKDAIRRKAAQTSPGQWIIARSSFGLAGRVEEKKLPTREELDLVTDRHPVILFSGFHVAMFNTPGLKAAGLWEPASPSIPRGATIHRDASVR